MIRRALTAYALLPVLVLFLFPLLFPGPSRSAEPDPTPGESGLLLWDLAADGRTTLEQAMPILAGARLVHVGEKHDQPAHHQAQLEIIRSLTKAGGKPMVGLEMIGRHHQEALDDWVDGRLDEEGMIRVFNQDWGYSWDLYREIFLYCRERGLGMVGLNVPRSITAKVARQGFKSLTEEEMGLLPPIVCLVDPEYEAYMRRVFGMFQGHGGEFNNFCEAQLVWDSAMAVHALAALNAHPERNMVVLTGMTHAWEKAVPARVRRKDPAIRQISLLPLEPGQTAPRLVDTDDADYLYFRE